MYEMVQNNNDFFVSRWVSCTNLSNIKPSCLFYYSTSGSKSYATSKLVIHTCIKWCMQPNTFIKISHYIKITTPSTFEIYDVRDKLISSKII
jgi:hypothetical protein